MNQIPTKQHEVYKFIWLSLVIAIIACGAYVIYRVNRPVPQTVQINENTNINQAANEIPDNNQDVKTEPSAPVVDDSPQEINKLEGLSYDEAIKLYQGRRIQFENCTPNPTAVTYKNGTEILLDNRSADGQEIIIDGVSYELWGHEVAVAKLTHPEPPHTITVDCRSAGTTMNNIMTILLQP